MSPGNDSSPSETSEPRDARIIPEPDDEGKTVVDTEDREIGTVTGVEGDTMYVTPEASLTEKIKQKLDWADKQSEDLPVSSEFVSRIDDQVVLAVERDEEFHEGAT